MKRLNPGWDLLLNAGWNESLQAIGYPSLAVAAPSSPATKPEIPELPKPETVTLAAAPSPVMRVPRRVSPVAMAAGVLLVLGSALAWRTMRRQP